MGNQIKRKGAGRPPRPGEWTKVTIRLPRSDVQWMKEQDKSMGDLVAEALEMMRGQMDK